MFYRYLLFTICLIYVFSAAGQAQDVELKNNYFYIDGQKFFVKGIGYEANAVVRRNPFTSETSPYSAGSISQSRGILRW